MRPATALDLTPLMRSTVGFERLNDIIDSAFRTVENAPSYPPYNIEKVGEQDYRVTLAVAGFKEDELEIVEQDGQLTISGQSLDEANDEGNENGITYLHRGIAKRAFKRTFNLADHVKVVDAALEDGLLTVNLRQEIPETAKPKKIAIGSSSKGRKAIKDKAEK